MFFEKTKLDTTKPDDELQKKMNSVEIKTSRDRPKSAPYLGSKIAKGLQYVKVLVSWGPFYERKILEKKSHNAKKIEGATLWGNFFSGKKSHSAEKN